MASVTVNLTGFFDFGATIGWGTNVSLGSTFSSNGTVQTLDTCQLNIMSSTPGRVNINIIELNSTFTAAFEATGRIIFTASDGETLEVMIADADMTEPYSWTPTNSAEVITFAVHVQGLTDHNATLTLTDDPPPPPAIQDAIITDDTGDELWRVNIFSPSDATGPFGLIGDLPSGLTAPLGIAIDNPAATHLLLTTAATNSGGSTFLIPPIPAETTALSGHSQRDWITRWGLP